MSFNLNIESKKTTNKCVRFPNKLIKDIKKITSKNQVTFSQFVIEACKYALENIEKPTTKKEKVKN